MPTRTVRSVIACSLLALNDRAYGPREPNHTGGKNIRELIRQKYIVTVALVVFKHSRISAIVLVDHGQPFHYPLREGLSAIRPYQGTLECYGSTLDREVFMTEADLYVFMARHRLGILATICPNATPQSALMGIAITPQLEIVFDTVKGSRKYPNLIARPACHS